MLRLHFTAGDLLRTRFAAAPAPLLELGLALTALQRRDALFGGWRHHNARQLPARARALFELVPASGTGPTFIDPISATLEDGMEQVLSAPTSLVTAELRRTNPGSRPVTAWLRALDERDVEAWHTLDEALRSAHHTLLVPSWHRIQAGFRAELALRSRLIAETGLFETLRTLHPGSVWSGTTLHIPAEVNRDQRLSGQGLTLMPSAFWTGRPLTADHPDGSTLFIYPASTPLPLTASTRDTAAEPLSQLLGHTRAAILRSTATPRTTTELGRELDISAAAVSQHTKILRSAGLITTQRDGKAVLHQLTPLGQRLLLG